MKNPYRLNGDLVFCIFINSMVGVLIARILFGISISPTMGIKILIASVFVLSIFCRLVIECVKLVLNADKKEKEA